MRFDANESAHRWRSLGASRTAARRRAVAIRCSAGFGDFARILLHHVYRLNIRDLWNPIQDISKERQIPVESAPRTLHQETIQPIAFVIDREVSVIHWIDNMVKR